MDEFLWETDIESEANVSTDVDDTVINYKYICSPLKKHNYL